MPTTYMTRLRAAEILSLSQHPPLLSYLPSPWAPSSIVAGWARRTASDDAPDTRQGDLVYLGRLSASRGADQRRTEWGAVARR